MNDLIDYLKRINSAGGLKGFLYALLIFIVYQSALKHLVLFDWSLDDYSHCYLIPFVVIYLIWEKCARLKAITSSPSWFGLLPIAFGIGLFWLGELGGEFFTMYVSMWLVVVGLLWLHLGWEKIKTMGFALCIALTMYSFPNFINFRVLVKLKLISSQLGMAMLQLYGMSAYREGNIIDLGFTQLQVVDACCGMRYVLPRMVLTDSGGLQEETTALGVPCVTIRENTERPITVELGTNVLAGTSKEGILKACTESLEKKKLASIPPLWDGKASERIWDILLHNAL